MYLKVDALNRRKILLVLNLSFTETAELGCGSCLAFKQ
jgi:hypothetical protein